MSIIWFAERVRKMEEGKWINEIKGNPLMSNPMECYVAVVLYGDYIALQAENERLVNVLKANSEWRLRMIAQLMKADPHPDSEDGKLLNRLVDEQVEAEKDIVI